MEIWENIIPQSNKYQINQNGEIRNRGGKIMSTWKSEKGYEKISLIIDNRKRNFFVHRLVAEAFIPNPDNKPCVDHIDGNKKNNNVCNLRWASYSENNNNPNTKQRFYRHMWN